MPNFIRETHGIGEPSPAAANFFKTAQEKSISNSTRLSFEAELVSCSRHSYAKSYSHFPKMIPRPPCMTGWVLQAVGIALESMSH